MLDGTLAVCLLQASRAAKGCRPRGRRARPSCRASPASRAAHRARRARAYARRHGRWQKCSGCRGPRYNCLGGVDAVPLAGQANVHHGQSRLLAPGERDGFFRRGRRADHVDSRPSVSAPSVCIAIRKSSSTTRMRTALLVARSRPMRLGRCRRRLAWSWGQREILPLAKHSPMPERGRFTTACLPETAGTRARGISRRHRSVPCSWRARPRTSCSPEDVSRTLFQIKSVPVIFDVELKSTVLTRSSRPAPSRCGLLLMPCFTALVRSSFRIRASGIATSLESTPQRRACIRFALRGKACCGWFRQTARQKLIRRESGWRRFCRRARAAQRPWPRSARWPRSSTFRASSLLRVLRGGQQQRLQHLHVVLGAMVEFVEQQPLLRFRLPSLADVDQHVDGADDLAGGVAQRRRKRE